MPDYQPCDLDSELVFDRVLGQQDFDDLQRLLAELAPCWSSKLRIWRSRGDQRTIDITKRGMLGRSVLTAIDERGPTYAALVEQFGRPQFERQSGSAELRGAGPELNVVVMVDAYVLSPLGDKLSFGNLLFVEVRRPRVERQDGVRWLTESFRTMCEMLKPAWGYICHPAEYWSKVMSLSPSVEAIGRDFGRYLPGLFWLNFFGPRYQEVIGIERLRTAPADVTDGRAGSFVTIGESPFDWTSPAYADEERKVRAHLGRDHFFEKS